jgi:hypothetical protein
MIMGVTLAKIETVEGTGEWTLDKFHRVVPSQLRFEPRAWKVLPREGVLIAGEKTVRRSPGNPDTLKRVHTLFGKVAGEFWDPGLFLAVIANESRGVLNCERYEERLGDYSFGPGQFLTSTAYGLLNAARVAPPDVPVPKGGNPGKWRTFLCEPRNSMPLIRSYLTNINRRFGLKYDPVLIYAAYNAGSPRPSLKNDWGLVTNRPETLDHISAWYGDAWFVLNRQAGVS